MVEIRGRCGVIALAVRQGRHWPLVVERVLSIFDLGF
jgi:hypothetical protein